MLTLYDTAGHPLHLSFADWQAILETASSCGWRPAGISRPPIHFDIDRPEAEQAGDSSYTSPQSQPVFRPDAQAMIQALQKAKTRHGKSSAFTELVQKFCRFSRNGFLICEGRQAAELPEDIDFTGQLLNIQTTLGQPVRQAVGEESTAVKAALPQK